MNIVNFGTEERTMTSREIAELTGKRHKHVHREIEVMLDELGLSCIDFAVALPDSYGRMKPCFRLPKRETFILLTRIPCPMNQRVIDRWDALETGEATPAAVRTMTSREIAELTGKQHKDVLYDIRKMLNELCLALEDFSADLQDSYGLLV